MLVVGRGATQEAVLDALSRRGEYEVSAPGADTAAMSRIDVADPSDSGARIEVILGAAHGRTGELAWGDPAWRLIELVSISDAVVVAGGLLDSRSPEELAEQLLMARLAAAFHTPLVLSGQSVGMLTSDEDRDTAIEILSTARLAGLADDLSHEWALHNVDEAAASVRRTFSGDATAALRATRVDSHADAEPYVLVDLDFLTTVASGAFAPALGGLLDHAAKVAAARLVIVDSTGAAIGAVADATSAAHEQALAASDRGALARSAALVLTGGADLCCIAAVAGVPVLAISTNGHADRALTQALGDFGLSEAALPAAAVATGDAVEVLERIVRHGSGPAPADLIDRRRVEDQACWDELHSVLAGRPCAPASLANVAQTEFVLGAARQRVAALKALQSAAAHGAAPRSNEAAELDAAAFRIGALQGEMERLAAERDSAVAELAEMQLALRAAHAVSADVEQRLRLTRPRVTAVVDAERQARQAVKRIVRQVSGRLGDGDPS